MESVVIAGLVGFVFGSVFTMILFGVWIVRPRNHELMDERDDWQNRALFAEGAVDRQEGEQVSVEGDWGPPVTKQDVLDAGDIP